MIDWFNPSHICHQAVLSDILCLCQLYFGFGFNPNFRWFIGGRGCLQQRLLYIFLVFMSQQRQNKMVGANNAAHVGDTTHTKIFVGGLAWQTQRDSLQRYFEQFGEIQEAVVILDKNSGRSKGYGFVSSSPT